MANTLQWNDLSLQQINQFYDTNIQQNAIKLIESWFPSDESLTKKRILYDFYYFILMFAKEINLEPIQTSIFFSIMKKTHEVCISSPYMKLEEDYALFQNLILKHSIDRPPFSKKYFSLDQISKITEYATNTYFRHYSLYKYTFTKQQKLTLNTNQTVHNQEEKVEVDEMNNINETETNQQNDELLDVNDTSVSIIETEKGEKDKESDDKEKTLNETEEMKTEQEDNTNTTENIVNTENKTDNKQKKNDGEGKEENNEETEETEEKVKGDGEVEGNKGEVIEEEKEKEISPREKAITDLKVLIENAIGPKIQELKTTLTTMLTNSEDQLIKQIKKMDEAKKKAAKEATVPKKGEKEKDDKKKPTKGKKK
ncbi:hypothetical protein BCR32DRAFT_10110 [Anaeromyces robustus]|uniref:Uncharacterized protein n=1 Tax=Anaeromyces robustus TaxID=1754192 RepID=A0A1Y1X740_9FUNG|nr:hypothetical protein BCR32DRAFT_10110 [Anaeromyces robustus]|eukprot:ORX81545.1 hypothetical protein BCR32DRAFT_10110 [Anaeromyces robustus]